jgi:hypothetical protein
MQKLFAPLLLLVFIFPLFGQSNYAGLTGGVTDAQNLIRGLRKRADRLRRRSLRNPLRTVKG